MSNIAFPAALRRVYVHAYCPGRNIEAQMGLAFPHSNGTLHVPIMAIARAPLSLAWVMNREDPRILDGWILRNGIDCDRGTEGRHRDGS